MSEVMNNIDGSREGVGRNLQSTKKLEFYEIIFIFKPFILS